MTSFNPTIKALFVVTFMLVVASAAQAQTRMGVRCRRRLKPLQPHGSCKTFAGAINKTAKDGEISFSIQAGMAP